MKKDQRFTINHEYCGHSQPRPVIRFCGEFIASYETQQEAETQLEAMRNAAQWVLVQSKNNVQLYSGNNGYRVAYGAHVKDYTDYKKAIADFESCVQHDKDCNR